MERPCVRVPRERGEGVRRELADAAVLDTNFRIAAADGWLFIPIHDESAVPRDLTVEWRSVPPRETQTSPGDVLGEEPTYERLGEIALIDEDDRATAKRVAAALLSSSLPITSVLNAVSKVKGQERVREWELVAGEKTETVHREYGVALLVDVTEVYFSPRLATERHRVVEQVAQDERVFDMFAGVGPFAIPIAARGATVVAVDVNPRAIAYLEENARRNDVSRQVRTYCGDVREFAGEYANWADRIVMNLPHTADEFLPEAVTIAGDECVIHYYDIQSDEDPFSAGEHAIREAFEDAYEVTILERQEVRSYAPHEVNVCLDARVRRRGRD